MDTSDGRDEYYVCPQRPDAVKLSLGAILVAGLLISYLPQIIKLFRTKSSDGLSKYTLLLGAISCTSTMANTIMLQFFSINHCIRMCQALGNCIPDMMGIIQTSVQFICYMAVFSLYFIFFPTSKQLVLTSQFPCPTYALSFHWKTSLAVAVVVALYTVSVFLTAGLLLWKFDGDSSNQHIQGFASAIGLLSAVLSSIQFVPQIFATFRRRSLGALSLYTLLIQCPGSAVMVYSLMIQPGLNYSSWISFVASGSCQFVLLVLGIIYTVRENLALGHNTDERQSLLGEDNQDTSRDSSSIVVPDGEPNSNIIVVEDTPADVLISSQLSARPDQFSNDAPYSHTFSDENAPSDGEDIPNDYASQSTTNESPSIHSQNEQQEQQQPQSTVNSRQTQKRTSKKGRRRRH